MVDLVEMIFFHAQLNPGKPAIVTSDAILSYVLLKQGILAAHRKLLDHGLRPGQRVGIHILNPVGHITLLCALHRAGIASVSMEQPQIESLTAGVVDALLTDKPIAGTPVQMLVVDETWFAIAAGQAEPPAEAATGEGLCRMVFSSGTTGQPKVIGIDWAAVEERIATYSIRLSKPSWDRILCMPGLSTNYGYSFLITTLWLGRTMFFPLGPVAREMIVSYQIEVLVASTHQISTLVQAQEESLMRLDSLRAVHIGGSVAYLPLLTRIRMFICNNVLCGYGSTEGGTVAYAPVDCVYGIDRAVGILAPWIDVETLDAEQQPQELGAEGQIRLRALGQGYLMHTSESGAYEMNRSEWFYPGDQGIVYRNGLMIISGRINEIINRGGVKISPDAIEEHAKKHPLIQDAAAVGVLDAIGIEQIWMGVVVAGDKELNVAKIFEFFRETMPQLTPDRIFPIESIPRNRLGKVPRETLKGQLQDLEARHVHALR